MFILHNVIACNVVICGFCGCFADKDHTLHNQPHQERSLVNPESCILKEIKMRAVYLCCLVQKQEKGIYEKRNRGKISWGDVSSKGRLFCIDNWGYLVHRQGLPSVCFYFCYSQQ